MAGQNSIGVDITSTSSAGYGVRSKISNGGSGTRYAVCGDMSYGGSGATLYALYGRADGTNGSGGINYGVYGTAANGATNWAGYFVGNVGLATASELRFFNPAGTYYSGFKAGVLPASITYTLPIDAPAAGEQLTSTAGGVLSWEAASSIPAATGLQNHMLRSDNTNWVDAGTSIESDGTNVGIGMTPATYPLNVTGITNTSTYYYIGGSKVLSKDGTQNILVGVGAGSANAGANSTFLGYNAGYNNQNSQGGNVVYIGCQAGALNAAAGGGSNDVYIGYQAGYRSVGGTYNVMVGNYTGAGSGSSEQQGSQNTFIGYSAGTYLGYNNNSASNNTCLGWNAGKGTTSSAVATNNVFIGDAAGTAITTGDYNTVLGSGAGSGITTGSNNVVITSNGSGSLTTENGQLRVLGGTNGNFLMRGDFSTSAANQQRLGLCGAVVPTAGTDAILVGTGATNGNLAHLTVGGTWTSTSSRELKEDFEELDGSEILHKVCSLDIPRWKYKKTNEHHIGPMAEDFYKLFRVGTDNKSIADLDGAGVALRAIQEQQKEINNLKEEVRQLKEEMNRMKGAGSVAGEHQTGQNPTLAGRIMKNPSCGERLVLNEVERTISSLAFAFCFVGLAFMVTRKRIIK